MDELTTSELNRLILHEPAFTNRDELSHTLSLIFQSCTVEVPKAEDLVVPLSKIPPDSQLDDLEAFSLAPDGAPMVPLYNTQKRRWNWPLPTMHGQGRTTKKSEREGTESGTKEKSGEWVLIDETNKTELLASGGLDAPLASTSEATESMLPFADADLLTDEGSKSDDGEDRDLDCLSSSAVASEGPLTTERIFSSFFNVVSTALLALQPDLAHTRNLSRTWSAANSSRPVPGEEIPRKPDLTLLDDVEARWDTIKAVCELTSSAYKPSSTLAKTLDTKAYLLLKHQPWRRFALLISLCNGYRDLRVHLYDHSGGVVSPCTNIDQEPDRYLYILSCVVFGNLECIGYDTTISIFAHTLPQTLKTHSTCLLQNEGSSQDVAPTHSPGQIESTSPPQFESTSSLASTTPQIDLETEPTEDNADEDDGSFPVELPIEIPQDPLLEPLPEPIGKIRVNDHFYDILDIIFSRQGLVGRGTVCYHVRKNDEEFIIKDYWAIGGNKEALNEIKMMEKMKGVRGVPQLVEYWLVEVTPGKVDQTVEYRYRSVRSLQGTFRTHIRVVLKPRGRPLHKFRTKYELLASVRDIVQSKYHTL